MILKDNIHYEYGDKHYFLLEILPKRNKNIFTRIQVPLLDEYSQFSHLTRKTYTFMYTNFF